MKKMLLQPVLLTLLAFLKESHQSANDNNARKNLAAVINDVIKLDDSPVKNLNAFLCWKKRCLTFILFSDETNEFLRAMMFFSSAGMYQTNLFNYKNLSNQQTRPLVFSQRSYLFLLDLSCPQSKQALELAAKLNLFKSPSKWILLLGNSFLSDLEENLINFYFGIDSRIYIIKENPEDSFSVDTIYKYGRNSSSFVKNPVGEWKNSTFLVNLRRDYLRTNLQETAIRISYVLTHPDSINHLTDYRDKHLDAISKMNYILVDHLMDFLNATKISIIRSTWGYKNASTGVYSGMAGDLQTGFADLGGTPLFFTSDRVEIIDYVAATTPTFMKFIFRAPPLSYVTNVYTLPFDATVWHYSFIMIAVIGACIYVIVLWEWKDPEFREKITTDSIPDNIFDVFMLELGAVTQQGSDKEPKSYAGRIATIFTFLVLMFMYTSYSANIVALLQSTTDSIRTLEDLLNSRIKLGAEDIVYAHHYFKTAQEPTRKAIYQQKIAPKGQKPNFMTIEEGIKRVQQGFFAFHVELANGYKVVGDLFQENEKCGLKEIEYVNLIEPWLSAQKNSPYKEVIKIGMKKIVESGVRKREYNRIYSKKPACQSTGSNFGSVGMIDCYSAFLIFAIGILASVLLLLVEVAFVRYKLRKNAQLVRDY